MIWKIALALITAILMSAQLGYSCHVANAQSFSKPRTSDEKISTELRKAYLQSSSDEEGINLYFDNVGRWVIDQR